MTCAELQELAFAYVLGVLDAEERAAVAAHLAEPTHQGCEEALIRARRVAGQVPDALDDLRPSEASWKDLAARVGARRSFGWVQGLGWAAAVGLAVLAVWLARGRTRAYDGWAQARTALHVRTAENEVTTQALAILEQPGGKLIHLAPQGAHHEAALAAVSADGRRAVLVSHALPPLSGKDYELWTIVGGTPVPAGLIRTRSGALVTSTFDPAALAGATALAVSIEPVGGSPNGKPTEVLLVGALNG